MKESSSHYQIDGNGFCSSCKRPIGKSEKKINQHELFHNPTICHICKTSKTGLFKHTEVLHVDYVCAFCKIIFETTGLRRNHFKTKHRGLYCELCHRIFVSAQGKNSHLKTSSIHINKPKRKEPKIKRKLDASIWQRVDIEPIKNWYLATLPNESSNNNIIIVDQQNRTCIMCKQEYNVAINDPDDFCSTACKQEFRRSQR